jgi:hypothetical protein
MTYIPEAVFEARASELWQKYGLEPAFDVEELADRLGLGLLWEEEPDKEDSVVLGLLDPTEARIILNEKHLAELEANGGRLRRYTMGHEIGHWIFHADAARSGTLASWKGIACGAAVVRRIPPSARPRCSRHACWFRGIGSGRRFLRPHGMAGAPCTRSPTRSP